jgi:hypothetical protein
MILLFAGCAMDLAENHDWNDGEPVVDALPPAPVVLDTSDTGIPTPPPWSDPLITIASTGLGKRVRVDARGYDDWRWIDLDTSSAVPAGDPAWDLRFRRFHGSVNGGVTGDGGAEAAFVADIDFTGGLTVPETGWRADAPDGDDTDTEPDYALFDWYAYDSDTHILTPVPGVWFVRTTAADVYALRILDYYDENGTSGVFSVEWRGPIAD